MYLFRAAREAPKHNEECLPALGIYADDRRAHRENMSFLDRFQNKIAMVTAHGHLKKADGSEEIRVGPPKRKQKPVAPPIQAKATTGANQQLKHVQVQPSARGRGAVVPPIAMPQQQSGKQQPQQENTETTSARRAYPSPNASPRSKTQRDGYDYESNNYSHQHGAPHKGMQYREPEHTPGQSGHDDYGYDSRQQPQYGRCAQNASPGKGKSSEKEYSRHQQYQQPSQEQYPPHERTKNRSPVPVERGQQDECPSPRDRNEARVHTDEDQLAFSRKARPVQFAPCTLSQYKKEKPAGYYELGKLQPDLNADELVQKRANLERIKSFSKNLRQINKSVPTTKKTESETDAAAQKKVISTREKALAFAKHVPKPRLQQRPLGESSGSLSAASSSDNLPTIRASPRPINSIMDDDADEDDMNSELQQLQLRHQQSRAQVDALMRIS